MLFLLLKDWERPWEERADPVPRLAAEKFLLKTAKALPREGYYSTIISLMY